MSNPTNAAEWKMKYDGLLASFYDADHSWRDYQKQANFVAQLGFASNAEILDMCCGSGSHGIALAQRGLNVLGVDMSVQLLKQARNKMKNLDVPARFHKCNVFTMSDQVRYCSRFDGVILLGWTICMESVYKRVDDLLRSVCSVLKPGGLFIFDVPLAIQSPSPKPLEYEAEGMKALLRIRQKANPQERSSTFLYDWNISGISEKGPDKKMRLKVQETLCHLQLEDIREQLSKFKQLQPIAWYGDYKLEVPFHKGHKNLIGVIKNVFSY